MTRGLAPIPTRPILCTPELVRPEKATLKEKGDNIEVKIAVNTKIKDPWDSKKWDGNGFSIQMFFLFIDTDHKKGSGHSAGLPGLNVKFDEASRWEKVLVISPQGTKRLPLKSMPSEEVEEGHSNPEVRIRTRKIHRRPLSKISHWIAIEKLGLPGRSAIKRGLLR